MDLSDHDDAADFRPFFDMVIGILFVLLILVAAQIYFQQVQDKGATTDVAKREAALRRAEIATFLGRLAERLRADGIAASPDIEAGAVTLPLGDVAGLDAEGLPEILRVKAGALGTTLSEMTACVTEPRRTDPACADVGRLHLDALGIDLRMGTAPPGAALPRDRFGDLAGTLLSAALLRGAPALIGASNGSGGRVVRFQTALANPAAGARQATPDGDVSLDFTFQ